MSAGPHNRIEARIPVATRSVAWRRSIQIALGACACLVVALWAVFAPAAECALFAALVTAQSNGKARASARDMVAIVLANLTSFGVGELLRVSGMR